MNVFGGENKHVLPFYLSKRKSQNHSELLVIKKEDKSQDDKSHYVYIKDLDLYILKQSIKAKRVFNMYCLKFFSSEEVLKNHKKIGLQISGKQGLN